MGSAGDDKPGSPVISADPQHGELRYGLLIPSLQLPRWQASSIGLLDDVIGVAACVIVVERRSRPRLRRRSGVENTGGILWRVFDRRSRSRTPAFAKRDVSGLLAGVPLIEATVRSADARVEYSESDLEAIAATKPDFLLRFASGPVGGRLLDLAPLGVWSFSHGEACRGGPPGFWECYYGQDTTSVSLEQLSGPEEGGTLLTRAWFRTIKHSLAASRQQAFTGAAHLPAQTARRVLAGERDLHDGVHGSSKTDVAPARGGPGNVQMLRFAARAAGRSAQLQVRSITRADRWHVGILPRPISEVVADPRVTDAMWFPDLPQRTRYIADPFGCHTDSGDFCVLVEDLDHLDGHGVIASYRVARDGTVASGPSPVRRFPTHVSYPSLIRVGAQWWMVPESARANAVKAYLFDPDTATVEGEAASLLTGLALRDPTLFEWQGLWWLFATDGAMGANTHLRAWWAESPTGPWNQHAIDPLCIDVRSARGAGTPFEIDGHLYRPGQDNAVSYGGALTVKRVLELTPDRFREEWACTLAPDPGGPFPHGLHTLNRLGDDLTLVDALEQRFDRAYAGQMLRKRLRGLLPGRPGQ